MCYLFLAFLTIFFMECRNECFFWNDHHIRTTYDDKKEKQL